MLETSILGRTGLEATVAGLGAGGHSRLGLSRGKDAAHAVRVVQAALDLGVRHVDTAATYGTEEVVGRALEGRRDGVVLSSKLPITAGPSGQAANNGRPATAADIARWAEESLRRLRTDRIDILYLHAVPPERYEAARDELVPVLERLKQQGAIRAIGISERFKDDTDHGMLRLALEDGCWDVVMLGFNLVNQSAAPLMERLAAKGVGTVCAFAVRGALSTPERAQALVAQLVEAGEVDADAVDPDAPFDFLVREGGARSLVDAAYRFCRHAPGCDVVLTGTGDIGHLEQNLRSIAAPPLAPAAVARLRETFARVASVSAE